MKKLILWLTAAALLLSLCACDNGNESTDSSPKEKEQQTDFSHERCGVDAAPFFSYIRMTFKIPLQSGAVCDRITG